MQQTKEGHGGDVYAGYESGEKTVCVLGNLRELKLGSSLTCCLMSFFI